MGTDEVAHHAAWPISEIDYHARLVWLQERRDDRLVSWLEGDPEVFDAKAAGWWLYVLACSIGDPWLKGPWRVVDGHLVKGDAGRGVRRIYLTFGAGRACIGPRHHRHPRGASQGLHADACGTARARPDHVRVGNES